MGVLCSKPLTIVLVSLTIHIIRHDSNVMPVKIFRVHGQLTTTSRINKHCEVEGNEFVLCHLTLGVANIFKRLPSHQYLIGSSSTSVYNCGPFIFFSD